MEKSENYLILNLIVEDLIGFQFHVNDEDEDKYKLFKNYLNGSAEYFGYELIDNNIHFKNPFNPIKTDNKISNFVEIVYGNINASTDNDNKINASDDKEIDNISEQIISNENTTKIQKISKLTLILLNLYPDNYHRFLFQGLTNIVNHEKCQNNYLKNIDKIRNIFKGFSYNDETNSLHKVFYQSISCVIGAFIGDSLGSFVEFSKPKETNHSYVWKNKNNLFGTTKGQVTDDSEMALSMLLYLNDVKLNATFDKDLLAYYYGLWALSNPFDIGTTTKSALKTLCSFSKELKDNYKSSSIFYSLDFSKRLNLKYYSECVKDTKRFNSNSLSNGFLMRHTPMAIFLNTKYFTTIFENIGDIENYEKIFLAIGDVISIDIKITHCAIETFHFTFLYNLIIFNIFYLQLLNIDTKNIAQTVYYNSKNYFNSVYEKNYNNKGKKDTPYYQLIIFLEKLESNSKEQLHNIIKLIKKESIGISHVGYFLHSIKLCFYFLKFYGEFSNKFGNKIYQEIMFLICDLGGDTDTNCCIVGGVIGSLLGINNIEEEYVNDTLKFLPIRNFTDIERPVIYSPGLALFLILEIVQKLLNNQIIKEFDFSLFDINDNKFSSLAVILSIFLHEF